jgi:hypothetical protein
VPSDITGPIDPNGSPVTVTLTTPGQNAQLTFTSQAGRRVSLKIGTSCCQATVAIKNPDGTTLASGVFFTNGGFIDTKTLTQNGTYTVLVDPATTATGNVTVQLYDVPSDITGPINPGSPTTVAVTAPGQNALLNFTGQPGQQLTLKVGPSSLLTTITIKNPDGTTLAATVFGSSGGTLSGRVLAQPGQYTIAIDPQGAPTGTVTLTLTLI